MELHISVSLPVSNYPLPPIPSAPTCAALARQRWPWVLAVVCAQHGLTKADLIGRSRCLPINRARQEAYYELRAIGLSLPRIGQILHRDHTTIMSGIRAHKRRIIG